MTDNPTEKNGLCSFQGFLTQWMDGAILVWVCAITHSLGVNVLREEPTNKYERTYHILAWGVTFVVAMIPVLTNDYGPAGAWCWIEGNKAAQHAERFVLWYVDTVLSRLLCWHDWMCE